MLEKAELTEIETRPPLPWRVYGSHEFCDAAQQMAKDRAALISHLRALETENARLREALTAFVECALFDAMMEGPRFKGWNRSALHRALAKARAALQPEPK